MTVTSLCSSWITICIIIWKTGKIVSKDFKDRLQKIFIFFKIYFFNFFLAFDFFFNENTDLSDRKGNQTLLNLFFHTLNLFNYFNLPECMEQLRYFQ